MIVKRLPKDPGPAAWNALLPRAEGYPALEHDLSADWLVIGGGFAGLAAATRLKELCPSDQIVVLEATGIAEGPAGRNSGFMIDLPHDLASDDYGGDRQADRHQIRFNRAGIDFAARIAKKAGLPDEAFIRSGKINAAVGAKGIAHNKDYAAHLSSLGEAHTLLDADQMQEITGIGYYQGGLYTPGAAMIQPAMFIRGAASALVSNRASVFEYSPVTALDREGPTWCAKTPKGAIRAPKVILAVNGHLASFGHMRKQLIHVFTYASMTRAMSEDEVKRLGGQAVWACTPADPMGTTVRRVSGTGGDRIVIRNRFTCDPTMEVSDARLTAVSKVHRASFEARFPMLSGMEMAHVWGGRLCLSRNNVLAFGKIGEGLYAACCQNGLGTAKGTAAGLLIAEMAAGQDSALLNAVLAEPDPAPVPPPPFLQLGANAMIRFKEWRAGSEL